MSTPYAGFGDEHDSAEDIQLDIADDGDKNIKINTSFTKDASKSQASAKSRGVIKISLEEFETPSPPKPAEFQGFSVDEEAANTTQPDPTSPGSAQVMLSNGNNNAADGGDEEVRTAKKKKKKKKKSNKYKKNDGIDMMPLSPTTDVTESELIDSEEPQPKRKKSSKQSRTMAHQLQQQEQQTEQQSLSRRARIKQYINDDVRCWLFTGFMMSLFMFSFAAITVGIAEDLVIYRRKYETTICTDAVGGATTPTEAQLIGDVVQSDTIANYFTCCVGAVALSFVSLIAALLLICCKNRAKNSRDSLLVSASYIVIGIIGGCILCVWDVLLSIAAMNQLRDVASQCHPQTTAQQEAIHNAQQLLTEFDVMGALVVPLIFIVICSVYYVRIKLCSAQHIY